MSSKRSYLTIIKSIILKLYLTQFHYYTFYLRGISTRFKYSLKGDIKSGKRKGGIQDERMVVLWTDEDVLRKISGEFQEKIGLFF